MRGGSEVSQEMGKPVAFCIFKDFFYWKDNFETEPATPVQIQLYKTIDFLCFPHYF